MYKKILKFNNLVRVNMLSKKVCVKTRARGREKQSKSVISVPLQNSENIEENKSVVKC